MPVVRGSTSGRAAARAGRRTAPTPTSCPSRTAAPPGPAVRAPNDAGPSRSSSAPSSATSRNTRVSERPAWPMTRTVVLLAGPAGGRSWKKRTASAPCATACQLHSRMTTGALQRVDVAARGDARGLFHQPERLAVLEPAHQVVGQRHPGRRRVVGRVVVPGDEVQMRGPAVVVDRPVHAHEVRGHRQCRAGLPDGGLLVAEVRQHRVGGEPQVVQCDARERGVIRARASARSAPTVARSRPSRVKVCDQKVVYQASFSSSRVP